MTRHAGDSHHCPHQRGGTPAGRVSHPQGWHWVLCWEGTHGTDGSVLSPVYLHDLGIMHRDVKVGGSGAGGLEDGVGRSLNPQHGEATSAPVSFQMENILLDERGKSLVALPWGHAIRGDTPSMGTPSLWVPMWCLAPQDTSSSPTSASPGTCSGVSEPTQSVAPCSTWVRGAVLGGLWWRAQTPGCSPTLPTAPEVLSGGPYSHAADWWSLGVLLFALASGEVRTTGWGDRGTSGRP